MKTFNRILVVYSEKISAGHRQAVEGVRRRLRGHSYRMVRSQRLCGRDFDRVDLVITVGGATVFTGSVLDVIEANSQASP